MGRDVWITGIGLTSNLGEGLDAHWRAMVESDHPRPVTDLTFTPPFAIHPMVPLDLSQQIPRRADQRQMEPWQRLGTYTAGLALSDAGIAGDAEILSRTHAVLAADGGERDVEADSSILDDLGEATDHDSFLNERLGNDLRPTLFLAQLPNLLAGNISIVHKVTGSSRTFMGEEIAGVSAVEIAGRRIAAGQGDVFLVGGATMAARKDTILNCALGGVLWQGEPVPIWQRLEKGGGAVFGSVGAFLVLESREHAEARGRKPYARLGRIETDQSLRRPGDVAAKLTRQFDEIITPDAPPPALLSGATGVAQATTEERDLLSKMVSEGRISTVRALGSLLGNASSATFAALTGLAALSLSRNGFFQPVDETGLETDLATPPDSIVVTATGIWRGEGSGLILRAS
jgi:3-oxoacyl-[acyl-carrier-protein] synthase II